MGGSAHAYHRLLARRCALQVATLAALVAARGSSLTVVHSGSHGNHGLLLGTGVAVVGGAAFLRLRGLDNVLYVTRASFRNGVSTLGAGLQSVSVALARVRTALSERIDALSSRLSDVASDVEQTRAGVESLGEQLSTVEGKLDAVSSKQDFACRGVYLLCAAVSQALRKDGSAGSSDMSDASKKLQHHALEDKALLELLAAPPSGGHECVPLTGTLQEQLTAISTLAAANLNLTGVS